jgi:hypothetical protein
MRQKRQAGLRHPLPKSPIARIGAIDVVAVRQKLEHDGARLQAPLEFIEGVNACWMDADHRKKLPMFTREPEDVIVWDVEGAKIRPMFAIGLINFVLGQQSQGVNRRSADESKQVLDVEFVEFG